MTSLALFALNATADLGQTVARELSVSLAPHEEREFEDGEHKARRSNRSQEPTPM